MDIIGVTGGSGSGKSVVSGLLKKRQSYIIDCDKIAHDIILRGKPAYDEILGNFGNQILGDNQEIARKRLGDLVFTDKKKLDFLNQCTHKYVSQEILDHISHAKKNAGDYQYTVIDAPLFNQWLSDLCHQVWAVYADEDVRVKRIMDRDAITYEQALNRIASQNSWEDYKKFADVIIDNSKDMNHVEAQIEHWLNQRKGKRRMR